MSWETSLYPYTEISLPSFSSRSQLHFSCSPWYHPIFSANDHPAEIIFGSQPDVAIQHQQYRQRIVQLELVLTSMTQKQFCSKSILHTVARYTPSKSFRTPYTALKLINLMKSTILDDVMDEKGQVLFDNLVWFVEKLCSVMTSTSTCEHMWSIEGWIHD